MGQDISQEEAEQALEKAVKDFDWIGEFLGNYKEQFLQAYRAFHAQLKEGDELKIKIHKARIDREHKLVFYEPYFKIVLISGEIEEFAYSIGPDGTSVHHPENLLYRD